MLRIRQTEGNITRHNQRSQNKCHRPYTWRWLSLKRMATHGQQFAQLFLQFNWAAASKKEVFQCN